MEEKNQIFTSVKEAVKSAYTKASIGYGTFGVLTTGLYLNAQRIAESYVPGGIWNKEAYLQDWGADGVFATLSLMSSFMCGMITAFAAPGTFRSIHKRSNTQTQIDKESRTITQRDSSKLDENGFEKKIEEFEYDAILSVKVNQGLLERRADIGDLEITAIRLNAAKDKNYDENSNLVKKVLVIPYQKAPYATRDQIVQDLPKHDTLKAKLREA